MKRQNSAIFTSSNINTLIIKIIPVNTQVLHIVYVV